MGGSPPAKIQTKSLGRVCRAPLTSSTTESLRNSTGLELKWTFSLSLRMKSLTRWVLRSLMREKVSLAVAERNGVADLAGEAHGGFDSGVASPDDRESSC